jgi:hypothetical protein
MSMTVLGDVNSQHRLYLAAKPSHVGGGVNVDGLTSSLHCPTACNHQMRGQSFQLGTALSHHTVVGGGAFLGMRNPQAWIFDGVLTI